jgi:phosphoglycolate phosphatase-like HAD superfamily hydrolase
MLIGIDLDGTLLDSRMRHVAVLQCVAKANGLFLSEHDASRYFRFKCDGASGIDAMRQIGISAAEDISRQWIAMIENEEMLALDKLYPDARETLKRQRTQGNAFILVTGRQNAAAVRRQMTTLGIEEYFRESIVVDPRDRSQAKAAVTRQYGLDAVVGDTEMDLQWAKDLGVRFYASSFGFRSQSYWRRQQIDSHASLAAIFDSIDQNAIGNPLKMDH